MSSSEVERVKLVSKQIIPKVCFDILGKHTFRMRRSIPLSTAKRQFARLGIKAASREETANLAPSKDYSISPKPPSEATLTHVISCLSMYQSAVVVLKEAICWNISWVAAVTSGQVILHGM